MAIFNSYVSLPEGKHKSWMRWTMSVVLYNFLNPKNFRISCVVAVLHISTPPTPTPEISRPITTAGSWSENWMLVISGAVSLTLSPTGVVCSNKLDLTTTATWLWHCGKGRLESLGGQVPEKSWELPKIWPFSRGECENPRKMCQARKSWHSEWDESGCWKLQGSNCPHQHGNGKQTKMKHCKYKCQLIVELLATFLLPISLCYHLVGDGKSPYSTN